MVILPSSTFKLSIRTTRSASGSSGSESMATGSLPACRHSRRICMSRAALRNAVENLLQRHGNRARPGANDPQRHHVRLGHVRLQRQAQNAGDAPLIESAGHDHFVGSIATRGSRIVGGSVFGWFLTMSTASQPLISSAVMTACQRPGLFSALWQRGDRLEHPVARLFQHGRLDLQRLAVERRLVPRGQIEAQQHENSQHDQSDADDQQQAISTRHSMDFLVASRFVRRRRFRDAIRRFVELIPATPPPLSHVTRTATTRSSSFPNARSSSTRWPDGQASVAFRSPRRGDCSHTHRLG